MSDVPTADEIERALKQADCSVYYERDFGALEVHIEAEVDTPGDVLRQAYIAMRDLYLSRQTTLADAEVGDDVEIPGWGGYEVFRHESQGVYVEDPEGNLRLLPKCTPCTIVEQAVTFGDLQIEDEFRDTPGGPIYWKTGASTAVRVNVGTAVGLEVQVVDVDPDTEVEPVEDT